MIEEFERLGLQDLLFSDAEMQRVLPALYRSVSKQPPSGTSSEELFRVLCLCGQSVHVILNKRLITKKMLFDYVCRQNVPAPASTKSELIEMIITCWKDKFSAATVHPSTPEPPEPNYIARNVVINIQNTTIVQMTPTEQGPPPLQEMAEKFVSWLFEKINNDTLAPLDVWKDVTNCLRLIDSTGSVQDEKSEGSDSVLQSFKVIRDEFGFKLCPNICPEGVQGRMNKFGMVMIASCGTVTRYGHFAGLFEAAFGLLKESADTWKLKHSRLLIRSLDAITEPQLELCNSLQDILELPHNNGATIGEE